MLSNLFGSFADGFFQDIGASPIQVRYRNTVAITPTPIVSHEGVQSANEESRLSRSEAFSTYTVSIPLDVLDEALAGTREKPKEAFTRAAATLPNQPWFLSMDGVNWLSYRTLGDPEFEVFRVKLKLVAAR